MDSTKEIYLSALYITNEESRNTPLQQAFGQNQVVRGGAWKSRLAQEAADNGLLEASLASSISKVRGLRRHGVRMGRWLTAAGARELLGMPDADSVKGKRDRAVLAVLIGCGLRRSEVAAVAVEQFRMVEDRWVIADLVGKHGRIRTVAVPFWAKTAVDEWRLAGSILAGRLFRQITKRAEVTGEGFSNPTGEETAC